MSTIFSNVFTNGYVDIATTFKEYYLRRPTFLSLFQSPGYEASQRLHYWHESVSRPRMIDYTAATSAGVFTVSDASSWSIGDRCHIKGSNARAVLKVIAIAADATTITCSIVSANGTGITSSTFPTAAGTLVFDSHPMEENSTSGPNMFHQATKNKNYSEIFRYDIPMSRSAINSKTSDGANDPSYQIAHATVEMERMINKAVLAGTRCEEGVDSQRGSMGGLTFFDNQTGCIDAVDASGGELSLKHINDAAARVQSNGGNPTLLLCNQSVARMLSANYNNFIRQDRTDPVRGTRVTDILSDSTGNMIRIFVEPNLSDMDNTCWVMDPSGLFILPAVGGGLVAGDSTVPGTDGSRYTAICEMVAEFRDANCNICRITNWTDPVITNDSYIPKVRMISSSGSSEGSGS